MKRHASRIASPAGGSSSRDDPFDVGALSTDVENDIVVRVRAALPNRRAAVLVGELKSRFERFSWVGIYRLRGDTLTLDDAEYVGPAPEHRRIALADGVCGAAASERQTIVVPDVCKDSRYLACSPTVKSEIVVPILDRNTLLGVLDIDSDELDAFSDDDRRFLESLAARAAGLIRSEPVAAA
jgi:GAF domain-containing protein